MDIATDQVIAQVSGFNEALVRFHIVDQIIRKLGFDNGDDVYFIPEEKLEYPYIHIGRRNKKKDVPLGFPDYRAGLKGRRGCFIIEAKAGNVDLSPKDVEQGHSYAAHAQVGANYFAICNGRQFQLYETLSGPNSEPIVDLKIEELDERFHEIENVISPSALEKHCQVQYDKGLKLCDGLGSSATIQNGIYTMDYWSYRIMANGADVTDQFKLAAPQLSEMEKQMELMKSQFELRVSKGVARRKESGRIEAEVEFAGVTKNNTMAMRLMGIDRLMFQTDEQFISVQENQPTPFESTAEISLAAGSSLPEMFGGESLVPTDVKAKVLIQCQLIKAESEILGEYACITDYFVPTPLGMMTLELDFAGRVELELGE
jgi:hypothetical protein